MGGHAQASSPPLQSKENELEKDNYRNVGISGNLFRKCPWNPGPGNGDKASPCGGASQTITDQDIQLLRQDIRSKKKQLIAANLNLTTDEATKFWPVYDQYTAELVKINDVKYAAIKEYADTWGTMTNDQATSLVNRSLGVDQSVAQLRIKYVPIFGKLFRGPKWPLSSSSIVVCKC